MFDLEEARKRAREGTPPIIIISGEDPNDRQHAISNQWIVEWSRDKRLLAAAIIEIDRLRADVELLKSSTESELINRLLKLHAARKAAIAEENQLGALLDTLAVRDLFPWRR